MIHTELHAAGIDDERLRESYRYCRRLNAQHGRTYFLATRLLAPSQRPAVHALYGFARYADEIVDDLSSTLSDQEKADWLGSSLNGRPAWTPCRRSSSAALPTPASPYCPLCCTPPAPTASRWTCSTTSSPRCGWT